MKISDLAVSPVEMILNFEKRKDIENKSNYYYVDEPTTEYYCSRLNTLYNDLTIAVKKEKTGSFIKENWPILLINIIYILNGIFYRLEILNKVLQEEKKIKIEDDISFYRGFFPQYQSDLHFRLQCDKRLNESLLSALLELLRGQLKQKRYQIDKNYRNWFIRRLIGLRSNLLFHNANNLVKSNKKKMAIFDVRNIEKYLKSLNLDQLEIVNIDEELFKLSHLPSGPNLVLRALIKKSFVKLFHQTGFCQRFKIISNVRDSDEVIATIISYLLPVSQIEKIKKYKKEIEKIYNKVQPSLLAACSGPDGDFSAIFTTLAFKKGIKLLNFQHGTGYNHIKFFDTLRFVDTQIFPCLYFSWGQNYPMNNSKSKIIPLGSPYLNSLSCLDLSRSKIEKIFFPVDEAVPYLPVLEGISDPACVYRNVSLQINLLEKIHKRYPKLQILIKPRGEMGHYIYKVLAKKLKEKITLINNSSRAYNYYDDQTLVLCPTTVGGVFHEALMSGTRFVLYIDPNQEFKDDKTKEMFNQFIKIKLGGSDLETLYHSVCLQIEGKINYKNKEILDLFQNYKINCTMENRFWKTTVEKYIHRLLR